VAAGDALQVHAILLKLQQVIVPVEAAEHLPHTVDYSRSDAVETIRGGPVHPGFCNLRFA
jgi:hypothetical protein